MIALLAAALAWQDQVVPPKDAWAASKPGAWVRSKVTTVESGKTQVDWEDRVFEAFDADSITIRSDYLVDGAESTRTDTFPKLKAEMLAYVGEEEIEVGGQKYRCVVQQVKAAGIKDWMAKEAPWSGWVSFKQTMVDGPMTRTLRVKKLSKEKLKIREQEFDCIVIESEIESAWGDQKRVEVFRQWVSEAMPGAVVKLETESPGVEGKTVFRALEVTDWGDDAAVKIPFPGPLDDVNEMMRDVTSTMKNPPTEPAAREALRAKIRDIRGRYEKAAGEKLKKLIQRLDEWENRLK